MKLMPYLKILKKLLEVKKMSKEIKKLFEPYVEEVGFIKNDFKKIIGGK